MIKITDYTSDISQLMNLYPSGSVERQVIQAMNDSPADYTFDSLDELKFELLLRKETAKTAVALNNSGMDFSTFHKSRCNPDYWERTGNGGFRLREGVSPSAAIKDIYVNGGEYANECATAMQIVYYGALLKVFGEDAFDRLFPDIYIMNWNAVNPLLSWIGVLKNTGDILIGDRAYFSNPDVDPSTPEWQGENVIVLPDGMYYGHGIGIKTASGLINSLNRHRREDADQTAYLRDSVGRLDYKKLYKIYARSSQETPAPAASAFSAFDSLYI